MTSLFEELSEDVGRVDDCCDVTDVDCVLLNGVDCALDIISIGLKINEDVEGLVVDTIDITELRLIAVE